MSEPVPVNPLPATTTALATPNATAITVGKPTALTTPAQHAMMSDAAQAKTSLFRQIA